MSDRSRSTADERDLAARLRREASQTTPEFSQDLHARVMQAAGQAQRAATPARHGPRWLAIALVAAAIAIAVGVWMRTANRDEARTPTPAPAPVALSELVPPIPTDGFQLVRTNMEEQRLAYLDRDARQFASFVVAQLSNTIPSDRAAVVP